MSMSEHNERIEYLRLRKAIGTITADELKELQSGVRLLRGEPHGNNQNPMPIAVPAAKFDSYSTWAAHFNGGDVPEPVTVDDTHQTNEQASNDDGELQPDEAEVLEKMLKDLEKKR